MLNAATFTCLHPSFLPLSTCYPGDHVLHSAESPRHLCCKLGHVASDVPMVLLTTCHPPPPLPHPLSAPPFLFPTRRLLHSPPPGYTLPAAIHPWAAP
ncbi:hypothetical protein E2C01_086254 [Portunus trituberculatus]|uniref:Uncharacterized protein n=1 Tax=Portunus trituberculatus TaxID=210409 RepID=A0A5B7J3B1_PORTR|nr:hypothetical protein [Portunus trituberculatus]